MLTDLATFGLSRARADVCIIGAGAAGLALAHELMGQLDVIVLEAGSEDVTERSQALFRTEQLGVPLGGAHEMRFRTFGGSTTRWAGQAMPLLDEDFDARAWVPGSGWPITGADLATYYDRASDLLAIDRFGSPPESRWPAALAAPPAFDRARLRSLYSQFTAQPDFRRLFGAALRADPRVTIVLDATATEILLDQAQGSVDLVRARSLSGQVLEVASQAVVLCAGGIETARLLLMSTARDAGGVGNRSDLVGRFLQDHPGFPIGTVQGLKTADRKTFAPSRRANVKYASRFVLSAAEQSRNRALQTGGEVLFRPSNAVEAGKSLYRALRGQGRRSEVRPAVGAILGDPAALARAAGRYFVLRDSATATDGEPVLTVGGEQAPNRHSRITLSDQLDDLGLPRPRIDWRLTEQDIHSARVFAAVAAEELSKAGLGEVNLGAFELPDDPNELSGRVVDAGHHMGSTRMGHTADDGVVDANCMVFDVENLFIASSSVFRTGGCSNPTFTILALALRLADRLKQTVA